MHKIVKFIASAGIVFSACVARAETVKVLNWPASQGNTNANGSLIVAQDATITNTVNANIVSPVAQPVVFLSDCTNEASAITMTNNTIYIYDSGGLIGATGTNYLFNTAGTYSVKRVVLLVQSLGEVWLCVNAPQTSNGSGGNARGNCLLHYRETTTVFASQEIASPTVWNGGYSKVLFWTTFSGTIRLIIYT